LRLLLCLRHLCRHHAFPAACIRMLLLLLSQRCTGHWKGMQVSQRSELQQSSGKAGIRRHHIPQQQQHDCAGLCAIADCQQPCWLGTRLGRRGERKTGRAKQQQQQQGGAFPGAHGGNSLALF
jgi:hypothetical protein